MATELAAWSGCPSGAGERIAWGALLERFEWLRALEGCPQDPVYHAEGDVLIHTKMVCEQLVEDVAWQALRPAERAILFAAALLHDVAKPRCTQREGERVRSPGHAKHGALMARAMLWEAGVAPHEREAVSELVRFHQHPYLWMEKQDLQRAILGLSLRCRADWLAILARADLKGRVCPDVERQLENVALFVVQCEEWGCLRGPYPFASDHSRAMYFRRPDRDPTYHAHDETWGEVVVMSGLPGAGKDHWLRVHRPGLAVVSLDAIRAQLGAGPTGDQGAVIREAYEQARERLRRKEPFAWSATNLTRELRGRVLSLAHDYGARARIVCVDTPSETLWAQNRGREAKVREAVIWGMAQRWEFPDLSEAQAREWVGVSAGA
jgi:putative nucleotidyltransferase with HDIG domain